MRRWREGMRISREVCAVSPEEGARWQRGMARLCGTDLRGTTTLATTASFMFLRRMGSVWITTLNYQAGEAIDGFTSGMRRGARESCERWRRLLLGMARI